MQAGVPLPMADKVGGGSTYHLTDAGRDLAAVVEQLGDWATTWVAVTHEHSDPGFALWAWCSAQMDSTRLPTRRTIVRFTFPGERPSNRATGCSSSPAPQSCATPTGGAVDVHVVADSMAFVDWHRGARSWGDALRSGEIVVSGDRTIARALPT